MLSMLGCDGMGKGHEQDKPDSNRTAVALSYQAGERAPTIAASGKGYLAEKIIEKAKEDNIPLHQDEKLAANLSKMQIGDMIPPELYEVVAEILVYVSDCEIIKKKISEGK